ncbi:hypothetical protein [Aestuariimicrobium ganziense]|uniref:hypothetical protein n=1 Tax=Aestuariimicrobium ganziense TaxID=2773677 RepID=UPI0019405AB3|nr:hypothetical protein [Aestuariimicrobium ganziense]
MDPTHWAAGDVVTLSAEGFTPGETISLTMYDHSTGTVVWSADAVATANADGTFTHDIVLKSDVPLGDYLLVATGDDSGKERFLRFYWGSPDPDQSDPTVVSDGGGGGLPSTGN